MRLKPVFLCLKLNYKNSQVSVTKKQQSQQAAPKESKINEYTFHNSSLDEVTILRKNVQVGIAIFALVLIAVV